MRERKGGQTHYLIEDEVSGQQTSQTSLCLAVSSSVYVVAVFVGYKVGLLIL